ncbi:MAG: hypothetical protein GX181_05335 [Synergistaceae bacterium]|nr:hypothetical protein [Synergistota bacterium]NLM71364.1 hypothetical protein [Synergistaceae bacterium]
MKFVAVAVANAHEEKPPILQSSKYTPQSLLLELEPLTTVHYTGKYKNRLVEATKVQREILAAFGIDLHASL